MMGRMACSYPVFWAESGLHSRPEKLRVRIAELIGELGTEFDTVLLLFGFCGNSLVGLTSGERTLVMPFVPDCIPIFLGSNEKRMQYGIDTYFFTRGYLRGEKNVMNEHGYYVRRYGKERALKFTKMIMEHYRRFAVIDTGAFDVEPVEREVGKVAGLLGIPVIRAEGDLGIIEDLLSGNWAPGRFMVIAPGGSITFEDSLKAGSSQIL
ncbi:MAG: DUF1638 domain-containing protein [Synergistaceae bacterium]|nr:DUF1638 domain-containing protein [Synergistaceae bacterium]